MEWINTTWPHASHALVNLGERFNYITPIIKLMIQIQTLDIQANQFVQTLMNLVYVLGVHFVTCHIITDKTCIPTTFTTNNAREYHIL